MPEVSTDRAWPEDTPPAEPQAPARIGWWWLGFVGIAGLVGLSVAMAVPFSAHSTLMDRVTGQTCEQQKVMFGDGVYRNTRDTALSRWLEGRDPGYQPRWARVSIRRHNVFGGLVSLEDRPLPVIAGLQSPRAGWASPLEVFVGQADEAAIARFVSAMQNQDLLAREAAVREVMAGLAPGAATPGPGLGDPGEPRM